MQITFWCSDTRDSGLHEILRSQVQVSLYVGLSSYLLVCLFVSLIIFYMDAMIVIHDN